MGRRPMSSYTVVANAAPLRMMVGIGYRGLDIGDLKKDTELERKPHQQTGGFERSL